MATEKFTGFIIETLPDKYVKIKFPARTSKSYGVSPAKPGFVKLDPTGEYVGSSKWIEYASVRDSFGMNEDAVELLANDAIKFAHNRKPFPKMKQNPTTRKTAARTQRAAEAYVRRPSQITKKAPSKRLKKRRTVNLQSPRGVFPNPSPKKRFKHFPDAMHYAYYLALEDFQNDNEANKYYIQKAGTMYTVDTWKSGPGSVEKVIGPLDARHMINLGYSSQDFKEKFKTKLKNNPSSVHFDIDVNSHNARGAKAKTRTNPVARKKEIIVEYELSGHNFAKRNRGMYGWKELAKFPDTPEGSENAIQYAEAYHKIAPHLRIQVVTK